MVVPISDVVIEYAMQVPARFRLHDFPSCGTVSFTPGICRENKESMPWPPLALPAGEGSAAAGAGACGPGRQRPHDAEEGSRGTAIAVQLHPGALLLVVPGCVHCIFWWYAASDRIALCCIVLCHSCKAEVCSRLGDESG